MQKSDDNQKAPVAHRRVMSSTTLNRKYVQRPSVQKVASIQSMGMKKASIQRMDMKRPSVSSSSSMIPAMKRSVVNMENVKARM